MGVHSTGGRRWQVTKVYEVPCAECLNRTKCETQELACRDFRRFVMRPYRPAKHLDRRPSKAIYDNIFSGEEDDEVPALA